MSDRSLQASSEGIKLAKAAFKGLRITQTQFSERTGKSRSTISNFFRGKPIDRILFVEICEVLKLEWQEIAVKTEVEAKESSEAIDSLVYEVREGIRSLVREQCGTMRVLEMTQPIQLTGEGGIYTNVNILEKITGRRRLEIGQLFENADLEVFDRVGLSAVQEEGIPGIQVVGKYPKLMVLGKPGAGKTTFLKYLAMNCIEGNFLAGHVPIFITLKAFAETDQRPDLLTYIETQITGNAAIREIIQHGRAFVLLDGLDEVREEDTKRVLQEIERLSQRFSDNHFVITCRIASKEYTFQNFTEVEVADFDDEQITTFVNNWFRCKDPKTAEATATRILEKLDANKPIKELASSPILLTLLCLECEESLEFPRNRADLYDRGVKVLLSKWDSSRKIERHQIYEKLSLNRKEDLLSQLARKTFEQKDYFFKQRTVEQHISDYIINLPGADTDPQALLIDSGQVLKAIEAHHGLLVERARGIYSFSHLTFQEYFTAREIVKKSNYEKLVEHLTDKRWREVFLLSANMVLEADSLLLMMKDAINELVTNPKLQDFLIWVRDKSNSVDAPYKATGIRTFYLNFSCALDQDYSLTIALDSTLHHDLYRDGIFHNEYFFNCDLSYDLSLDRALDTTLARIPALYHESLNRALTRSRAIGDRELQLKLQELRDQLPDTSEDNRDNFEQWWQVNGQDWTAKLRAVTIKYRNIGQDWQFSPEQKASLLQYYNANKLLVDCLNSDCYISRALRQEIEETLLLPVSEIEARKKA